MNRRRKVIKTWEAHGLLTEFQQEWKLEGKQEGKQEGMQAVFALLEKGYSPEEAKKKLQLA